MELYDFYADWCGPCKVMAPIIDQLEIDRPDITIVRIDVDEHRELAAEYQIQSIPTYIMVNPGKEDIRITGALPKARFLAELGLDTA
jgi:thioredoxin 1